VVYRCLYVHVLFTPASISVCFAYKDTDALAIYILNLFLAFLQPRFDPSIAADLAENDVEEGAPGLPGSSTPSAKGMAVIVNH
jgi:hypothetical protein